MKLLATALLILTTIHSASLAQENDLSSRNFAFDQAAQTIHLEQKDYETLYRTDQVPDTCYRDEQQGTRSECSTVYDRQCSTRYENECGYVNYPVCTVVPRNVCYTVDRCTTQNDRVCNSRGCTTVPRRVCTPVRQCSIQNDRVCRNESRYECRSVPRQFCQDVPRQVCRDVPNMVRVPYACTRPVQVPIGQRVKFTTVARVNIALENFAETGPITESLTARLNDGNLNLSVTQSANSAYLYHVVSRQKVEQNISSNEKLMIYTILVKATSVQQLSSFLNSSVTIHKIGLDHLEFNLSGFNGSAVHLPIKGHLKMLQRKNSRTSYVKINQEFSAQSLIPQGSHQKLVYKPFGINSLLAGVSHTAELGLKADVDALKKNIINADALAQISTKIITAKLEAVPSN